MKSEEELVDEIISELSDRSGLLHWGQIDSDIQEEIKQALVDILKGKDLWQEPCMWE